MFVRIFLILTLLFPLALCAADPVPDDQLSTELIGTWKMISAKFGGRESNLPSRLDVLKHVTLTHVTWMRSDPKTGNVVAMACGRWELEGNRFSDTPESGMGGDFAIVKDKTHTFICKIVGDLWYHNGMLENGMNIQEVWERQKTPESAADEEALDSKQ